MSNKHYIKTMWERAGLDTSSVERLELKLRNEAVKLIANFDWEKLDSFEYLASVFRTQVKNFFEFTTSSEEKNVSRKEKYKWMDWDAVGGACLERLSTKQTNEVYRMKLASKTMYGIYCATKIQYYADISQEIAANVNCMQWYIDRLDRWKDYFSKKAGNNKDGEILFPYMSNYKQYAENEQLRLFTFEAPVYVPKY